MRCASLVVLVATLGVSQAFVNQAIAPRSTMLFSDAVEEAEAAAPSWPAFEPTGLSVNDVKKTVKRITKENYQETLDKLQPYLINEAGQTFYNKVMRRLAFQSKELGMELPAAYAKAAKWNQARRAKQDAFIQAKEEERLAAEAEAAEAEAVDKEAAVEESAVEEKELVEA